MSEMQQGAWTKPAAMAIPKGGSSKIIVGGVRYWIELSDTGPHGFGGRLGMTFLFPAR